MPGSSPRRFPSPLRYPGGKGKIANYIKLLFLENDLVGHEYVELYAGGAAVALSLLFEEYASHIHINDLNRSVFAFWHAALNDTEALCGRIRDTAVSVDEWWRQKAVQAVPDPDPLDLAFSTFFLNRTNRSGIIDGGIIGGKEQDGDWKIDARYNKTGLIQRIQKIARFGTRITLTQLDAAEYLQQNAPYLPATSFLYLDPPYYVKGAGLYEHSYIHEDHVRVASLVRTLQHPWIVSYDAVPEILGLYDDLPQVVYGLSYSAAERYRGGEVMVFAHDMERPEVRSPANIRVSVVDRMRKKRVLAALEA